LPPLFADGSINAFNHWAGLPPKLLLSLALAINPLGLLLGAALLGPMSDYYGRRRILLSATAFCALGHLATAWALLHMNYPLFILARFATGLAEGNDSVARALLADTLSGEARAKAFAWLNGALYTGWLVGPLLAGATIRFGTGMPFFVAAAFLAGTWVIGTVAFPRLKRIQQNGRFWRDVGQHHSFSLLSQVQLRELFLIQLTYTFGVAAFYEYFPLHLVEQIHMKAGGIALMSSALCAVMAIVSILIGRGSMLGEVGRLRRYALATAFCILLTAVGAPVITGAAIIIFGIPNALYNAVLPVYCSERFSYLAQGALMGLISTTFCVSNVLVALTGAGITLIDTRLILLLGAGASAWAGLRIAAWIETRPALQHEQ
jgi:predicted MFS family arabinose efflux permease